MHMGVVGYLVTLANLQGFGGPNSQIKDLSVQVGPVASLAGALRDDPKFPIDNFRQNGYSRSGNFGKYLSNNVRKYLFDGANPGEEGTLITIAFKDSNSASESKEEGFSHILFRKHDLGENEIYDVIDKYLNDFDERHGGGGN